MSVNDLRAGFARLAETVVPEADPYGRLVRRGRRRRRARFAGLSGILAVLVAGTLAGAPHLAGIGSPRTSADGYPIESDWVRQLIASPARGNLAGDQRFIADVGRVFDRERNEAVADESLPDVAVLFAHEAGNTRTVAVAFHSDERAAFLVRSGRAGASASELADTGGLFNVPLSPFLTFSDMRGDRPGERPGEPVTHFTVGLAPASCEVSTSDSGTITPDGAVQRQWRSEPTGSYVVREVDYRATTELWRVTCGGEVRHQAPAQRVDEVGGVPAAAVGAGGARGIVDGDTAAVAVEAWRELTAAAGIGPDLQRAAGPAVVWGGSIPEDGADVPAVLVGPPSAGHGPLLLQRGSGGKTMVALGGLDATGRPVEVETKAASRAQWSLTATGVASDDLVAVRVPERAGGHAVLGERVLVVAPVSAVRIAAVAVGGRVVAEAPLDNGVCLLSLPLPANVTLRALNSRGELVASAPFVEQDGELRLFGEPLISNW